MRRIAFVAVLAAAGVLQGCGDEPTRTRVAPPQGSLPDDASLRPQAAAPAAPPASAVPTPSTPQVTREPQVAHAPPVPADPAEPVTAPRPATILGGPASGPRGDEQGAKLLDRRLLVLPVVGAKASALTDQYQLARGERVHEAIDIMAPAGTPVVAVDDGRIAKLFTSRAGGYTVYHFDPSQQLAYYYAHLDRYAPGLKEGMEVRRGDLIGDVGSTGNANPQAPHLHFAVFRLGRPPKWWEGEAVNPYPALSRAAPAQQVASR